MGNWNGTHVGSARTWAVLTSGESARYFWDGLIEREKAGHITDTLITAIDTLPASGDTVIQAGTPVGFEPIPSVKTYERVRAVMLDLARFFVRKVLADGTTNYWPEGTNHIDAAGRVVTTPGTSAWSSITFPAGSPGGFSRRFELTIYSLSNATTTGTRARFISYPLGTEGFFGVRTTDAGFNTTPTTPIGERQYDGKFFDVVGAAWTLSADQTTHGDTIEETGAGRRFRGDFHDGKVADETRDATNQLTRTAGFAQTLGLGQGDVLPYTGVATPSWNGGTADSATSTQKTNTPFFFDTTSRAHADASYATSGGTNVAKAFKQTRDANLDGIEDGWHIEVGQVQFVVPGDQYPTNASMPNPLAQTRTVYFFMYCTAQGQWDTQGRSDVQQDVWHEIPSSASNSGTTITGPTFGTTTLPANWPTGTPPGQRGFVQFLSCYILDWEVSGGFAVSILTP